MPWLGHYNLSSFLHKRCLTNLRTNLSLVSNLFDSLFLLNLTKEASVFQLLVHYEMPTRVTIWIHTEPGIVFPF